MITTDWRKKKIVDDALIPDIKEIAEIKTLKEHPNLLVFPHSFSEYDDGFGKKSICSFNEKDNTIKTQSILGFVGRNSTRLTIRSRFTPGKTDGKFEEHKEDFFLHYMLHKVFSINIFDLKHSTSQEPIFDFLLYMFPFFLKKALRQGLYKEYQTKNYNDANIRGVIDINRHIRLNIPFAGKVAYRTREYCYDNAITELVRHTIEFIRTKKIACGVLSCDTETKEAVSQITYATNNYSKNDRFSIINKNLRSLRHPYFHEYEPLRKICLQILRHEELKYGHKKDEIYGVLFDGAWLWEEYLGIILKEKFDHFYKNKGERLHLFYDKEQHKVQQIIPDYLSKDKTIVADAKYIPLDSNDNYGEDSATAIYYKTITYMYRWDAKQGYLFYPCQESIQPLEYKIIDREGIVIKYGLPIPQLETDFTAFATQMHEMEKGFITDFTS